jgi:hypothetical protein
MVVPQGPLYFNPKAGMLTSGKLGGLTNSTPSIPNQIQGMTSYVSASGQIRQEEENKKREILDKALALEKLQPTLEKLKKYSEKTGLSYREVLEAFLTEEQLELYNNRHAIQEEAIKIRTEAQEEQKRIKEALDKYQKIISPQITRWPDSDDSTIKYYVDYHKQEDRNIFHCFQPSSTADSKDISYQRLIEITN